MNTHFLPLHAPSRRLLDSLARSLSAAVLAAFTLVPVASANDCENSLVANGGFTDGLVYGSMPAASVASWSLLTNSPQVIPDGCTTPGALQMWGNLVVGESVKQLLPGAGIQAGKTYRLKFCYRFLTAEQIQHVRFRVTASAGAPIGYPQTSGNMVIAITPNTSSTAWQSYTSPDWTAPGDAAWITINPENDSVINDGPKVSWGIVDDVCLEEVVPCVPSWSRLRLGLAGVAWALKAHDDGMGGGAQLYAAGNFPTAGGLPSNSIARWNGTDWSPIGSGVSFQGSLRALEAFDDALPGGPALYAGGFFTTMDGVPAAGIARWDGTAWSALGSGIVPGASVHALVSAPAIGATPPSLYVGGFFSNAGGVAAKSVARWDGVTFTPLGSGLDGTNAYAEALAVFDDLSGGGPELYAAGNFTTAGGLPITGLAKWDGTAWSAVSGGSFFGIRALQVHDDGLGGGPALYVGGTFTSVGGVPANYVARWNGSTWSALGTGMNSSVRAMGVACLDGAAPSLYLVGSFTVAGGVSAPRVAGWDGTSFHAVGLGVAGITNQPISVAAYDDGTGTALFVGGEFDTAGGHPASGIGRWGCSRFELIEPGLASDFGTPFLSGAGNFASGESLVLTLTGARPSANCYPVVGGGLLQAGFKGGTMIPTPDIILGPFGADLSGNQELSIPVLGPLPAGVPIVVQHWIQDDTGPVGFAASNAVTIVSE